jgi:hypothetical protein
MTPSWNPARVVSFRFRLISSKLLPFRAVLPHYYPPSPTPSHLMIGVTVVGINHDHPPTHFMPVRQLSLSQASGTSNLNIRPGNVTARRQSQPQT